VPLELARYLRSGEAVVWWGRKDRTQWRPIVSTLVLAAALLAGASLVVPELWSAPPGTLAQAVAVLLAPAALLALRERLSRRSLAVTDTSILELTARGHADRIGFRNVRRVRRDFLTGGILLEGERHRVRVPPSLMDDARIAIASQTRAALHGGDAPDDPLGWLR
jgi:hypothetical protein